MTNKKPPSCPRCGAPLQAAAKNEPCAACLLSGALEAPAQAPTPREASAYPRTFGGYQLLGLLGKGGMGTVYEAEHEASGRRVALKMLDQRIDSTDLRQRFLREGRLAARVNHPNSLYVFGSEEIEGAPVITMEIAGGGTLEDTLKERGPLPTTEAVDAILNVVAGLEAAAANGVLHRDVKPGNCFIGPAGAVMVGDYGLSVSTLSEEDSLVTSPGVIMGTPAFAPPEQLRGDDLDLRADIYSVGATLFTLLTGRPPFEGKNVVQVVANAVNEAPRPVSELRDNVPAGLEQVVARCLIKEPEGRFEDYMALRNALLPFSSKEPEPASILMRVSTGWIDYLIAFLPPYLVLMFTAGAEALLIQPLLERTLYSARYYLLLLGLACLYFTVVEGLWGCGLGKWLKGLRVVRPGGGRPGLGRAFLRILIPILLVEGVRIPLTMTFISSAEWTGPQTAGFVLGFVVCGWIPALLALRATRASGYATPWDLASGTRVVVKPKGSVRAATEPASTSSAPSDDPEALGPFELVRDVSPGAWLSATDPLLHRPVWLLRRETAELPLSRRTVARPGRLRWLQGVKSAEGRWDAYEATPGQPFLQVVNDRGQVPWSVLRHWIHDLASELWVASKDKTLPTELSLDHVWITAEGRAILLDEPWPEADIVAERMPAGDVAGQQRFLSAVASSVETTTLPLHARPLLKNLEAGRFEKLSFLTGTLRGLLERRADVPRSLRVGAAFLVPLYVWIAVFVGYYHDRPAGDALAGVVYVTALVALGCALLQLLAVPFRSSVGQSIFGLAVVDAQGDRASRTRLLVRWAVAWLPLLLPMSLVAPRLRDAEPTALLAASVLLALWIAAAIYSVTRPGQGLHDRLASTWVVRR